MDDSIFHLLAALNERPQAFLEVCTAAGMKSSMEAVDRLCLMKRLGWVDKDDAGYTITDKGIKILEVERMSRGTMLLDLQPNPNARQEQELGPPKLAQHSSTLAPAFTIKVDRYGNPDVRPVKEVKLRGNMKEQLEEERQREFAEKLREDPYLVPM